jgi:hypothetical protein
MQCGPIIRNIARERGPLDRQCAEVFDPAAVVRGNITVDGAIADGQIAAIVDRTAEVAVAAGNTIPDMFAVTAAVIVKML